jgi:hypothetical protein
MIIAALLLAASAARADCRSLCDKARPEKKERCLEQCAKADSRGPGPAPMKDMGAFQQGIEGLKAMEAEREKLRKTCANIPKDEPKPDEVRRECAERLRKLNDRIPKVYRQLDESGDATITSVKGEATVCVTGGHCSKYSEPPAGLTLKTGESVSVPAGSVVQLEVKAAGLVQLTGPTEFRLSPAGNDVKSVEALWSDLKKWIKHDSYKVTAPNSATGTRN